MTVSARSAPPLPLSLRRSFSAGVLAPAAVARQLGLRLALMLGLLAGCNTAITLTEGGAEVRHGERAEMPPGCRLLSDVRIGIPPDAAMPSTEEELLVLLRNKTHEQGGNWVIVESSERRDANGDGEAYYRGRGTSFACPEGEVAAPPEETAGGEGGLEG